MSRNTNSVSRAKGQLGRINNSMRTMKKDGTDASQIHSDNLSKWSQHWENQVTFREAVLARRKAARENKKPASYDEQKIAFSGKMRNGELLKK